MTESDEDRLIGEWHELAGKVESGVSVNILTATGVLNEVLRAFAPTLQFPQEQAAISPFIASTRELEKSWNRRLRKALIDAAEAKEKGHLMTAQTILDRFIEQCPWTPFVPIAQDQRANYASGR